MATLAASRLLKKRCLGLVGTANGRSELVLNPEPDPLGTRVFGHSETVEEECHEAEEVRGGPNQLCGADRGQFRQSRDEKGASGETIVSISVNAPSNYLQTKVKLFAFNCAQLLK